MEKHTQYIIKMTCYRPWALYKRQIFSATNSLNMLALCLQFMQSCIKVAFRQIGVLNEHASGMSNVRGVRTTSTNRTDPNFGCFCALFLLSFHIPLGYSFWFVFFLKEPYCEMKSLVLNAEAGILSNHSFGKGLSLWSLEFAACFTEENNAFYNTWKSIHELFTQIQSKHSKLQMQRVFSKLQIPSAKSQVPVAANHVWGVHRRWQ